MSFAGDAKSELCRVPLSRRCCAQAEAYGVLLYCNMFSPSRVRIVTENGPFAQRLPALFRKLIALHQAFGSDPRALALHVNFAMLEEPCCRASFLRGAFLAGGSVTDPRKGYHLELATSHHSVSREVLALMRELDQEPKSDRKSVV